MADFNRKKLQVFVSSTFSINHPYGLQIETGDVQKKVQELQLRGLAKENPRVGNFFLITEAGRAFLNKYESWELASKNACLLGATKSSSETS